METPFIHAYLVKAGFFTWPIVGSGGHELVFASSHEPDEVLSQSIIETIGGKKLGKRLESTFNILNSGNTAEPQSWRFKGKYEEANRKGNEVSATLTFSDLGNLLTDAGREMHYLNGRLRYFIGDKVIPVYSSQSEISI